MIARNRYGRQVMLLVCLLCIAGVAAGIGPSASRTPTRTPSRTPSPSATPSTSSTPSITPSTSTIPSTSETPTPSTIPSASASSSSVPSVSPAISPNPSTSPIPSSSPSSMPSASISSYPTPSTTPSVIIAPPTAQQGQKISTTFVVEIVVPSAAGMIFIGGMLYFIKKRRDAKNLIPDIEFQEFQDGPSGLASPAELSKKTIGIFLDGNFVHATFLGKSGKPLCKSVPCILLYDKLLDTFMFDGNVTDESEAVLEILRLLGEDAETLEKVTKRWWGSTGPVKLTKGTVVINNEEFTVTEIFAKILGHLFSENAADMEHFNHCLVVVPAFLYYNSHKKAALIEAVKIAAGEKCHVDVLPQHRLVLEDHQHKNGTVFVSLTGISMEVVKKLPDGRIVGSFVDYGTRDVAYKLWKHSQNSWNTFFKKGCDVTWFVKQIHDVEAVIRKHVVDENAAKVSTVRDVNTSNLSRVMGAYNECIRKILILASCAHVIDFSSFSFQTLLKLQLDSAVQVDQLQLSELLDLILFRCVDFQSNAS